MHLLKSLILFSIPFNLFGQVVGDSMMIEQSSTIQASFQSDTVSMEIILATELKVEKAKYVVKFLVQGIRRQPVENQLWVYRKKKWQFVPNGQEYIVWYRKL
jgi:hypothetical protein